MISPYIVDFVPVAGFAGRLNRAGTRGGVRDDGTSPCCFRIVRNGIPCNHCPEFASPFEKHQAKPEEHEQ